MKAIIGHSDIINSFYKIIEGERFSHAHIFYGEDGIGKSIVARKLAIKIIGKSEFKDYVDIVQFKIKESKNSIGVNDIRGLIEEINKKPYEAMKKVVIIHNGDKMTTQAQNALLKTIEEPPKDIFIFILCENILKILDTIKSRCQIHKLKALSNNEIVEYFQDRYPEINDDYLEIITKFSRGIPGVGEKLINDETFKEIRDKSIELLVTIKNMNVNEILKKDEEFSKYIKDFDVMIDIIISFVRDTILYKETGNIELVINKDKVSDIKECANIFSFKQLNDIISIINDARDNITLNANNSLTFSVMLLKMQEV